MSACTVWGVRQTIIKLLETLWSFWPFPPSSLSSTTVPVVNIITIPSYGQKCILLIFTCSLHFCCERSFKRSRFGSFCFVVGSILGRGKPFPNLQLSQLNRCAWYWEKLLLDIYVYIFYRRAYRDATGPVSRKTNSGHKGRRGNLLVRSWNSTWNWNSSTSLYRAR